MDDYMVELHGVKVKVNVVDNATLIDAKIAEMRASLDTARPVMGLDIKGVTTDPDSNLKASMLLLCSEGRCLIFPKMYTLFDYYPSKYGTKLRALLADPNICFLGIDLETRRKYRRNDELRDLMRNEGVELGHFAARILKKPDLEKAKLAELGVEVGIDVKPLSGSCPDWNVRVFSEEGIKHAVHDVNLYVLPHWQEALGLNFESIL